MTLKYCQLKKRGDRKSSTTISWRTVGLGKWASKGVVLIWETQMRQYEGHNTTLLPRPL